MAGLPPKRYILVINKGRKRTAFAVVLDCRVLGDEDEIEVTIIRIKLSPITKY